MFRRFLVSATVLTLFFAPANHALALSCMPAAPPERAIEKVDLLFKGRAVGWVEKSIRLFEVDEVYKGEPVKQVGIVVGTGPWKREYVDNETVVVPAFTGKSGFYRVSLCNLAIGGPEAMVDVLRSGRR